MNNRQMRQIIHYNLNHRFGSIKNGTFWLKKHGYNSHISKMFYKELTRCLEEMLANKNKWIKNK